MMGYPGNPNYSELMCPEGVKRIVVGDNIGIVRMKENMEEHDLGVLDVIMTIFT